MNNETLTLGSLFDGSGGFPLAGILLGVKPIWAAEINPFPIRVTTKRIPQMKHYGDVSQINGADIEPVDIVAMGTPCQNLSIAGDRSGLQGQKSSLFYEAIRIIKEMREATNGRYPKYICWENVTGAFSSNQKHDFQYVLQHICRIVEETVSIPLPPNKWSRAGEVLGTNGNYSIAWRTFDSEYWGVPQRRERIFLIGDLTGVGAPKILFESEGVSRYNQEDFRIWLSAASQNAESFEIPKYSRHEKTQKNKVVRRFDTHFDDGEIPFTLQVRTGREGGGKGALLQRNRSGSLATAYNQLLVEPHIKNDDYYYRIRRMTPTECARLQGFPDWWCDGLSTIDEAVIKQELPIWKKRFETFRLLTNSDTKPKSDADIAGWLRKPCRDKRMYQMWGNGVTLPCVLFVLAGIVWAEEL